MLYLTRFDQHCFMVLVGLFLMVVSSCGDMTTPTQTTATEPITTPLYELPIPTHHIVLQGHLDNQLYVQIIDTSTTHITERSNSPVYTCECQMAGSCKINATGPHTIVCVPTANSCSSENSSFPDDGGHHCAFSKVSTVPSGLQTVMTLTNDFNGRNKNPMPFNDKGVRAPNYYTIEFKDPEQLQAKYTLKSGQVLVEYLPEGRGEPIRVSCSCSCPDGSDCDMTINSSNSISCYSKSSCMPETNGIPCDGCKFKIVAMSLEEIAEQTVEKELLGE